jgi:hypothetical protein
LLFEINEKPFGKTWNEWTVEWWKWVLSIPRFNHPAEDMTGKFFYKNQANRKVIFLVGTKGGRAERKITVSSGKSLLIPLINFTTSFSEEPKLKTDADLIDRAKSDIDDISQIEARIDGEEIKDTWKYRVESPPFDFAYPEDNIFGLPSGPTRGASDGYWLFVKHLLPGEHTISVRGACSSGRRNVGVTYNVSVKE